MSYRVTDCECYANYFLALALDPETGTIYRWERHNDVERGRPKDALVAALKTHITVTFNGLGYDWWMLSAYLDGYNNEQLHALSHYLIKTPMAQWRVTEDKDIEAHPGRHIDLMPVAPGIASLKVYAGRLHAPRLQDLPVHPDRLIDEPLRDILVEYCCNDCHATNRLHRKLKPQVLLRHRMGKQYGLELTSRSDPQIAEAVIKKLLAQKGVKAYRPDNAHRAGDPKFKGTARYDAPACLRFVTDELRAAFEAAKSATFELSPKGSLLVPPEFRAQVKFGGRGYKMGIGGLHSVEKRQAIRTAPGEYLTDLDVTSYYPSLILTNELYPTHLSRKFLDVYQGIVDDRISAKKSGDTVTAEAMKIVVNSSFGKFGNKYSVLYSPKLLLQTTVSGQLYLLMLIEMIELRTSCKVVSANTDGVTVHSPNKKQYERMLKIAREWETRTRMALEAVEYRAIFAQDVNNYLALKVDGKLKKKGLFAVPSLMKNPVYPIVQKSVVAFLANDVEITETVDECRDVRGYAQLRKVTGGALYRDDEVGSTVRWYHGLNGSPILYRKNANRVPGADKAQLINELPDHLPNDIDHDHYIALASTLVEGVGADL